MRKPLHKGLKLLPEALNLAVTGIWAVPIVIAIFNGLKSDSEIRQNVNGFPQDPVFANWLTVFVKGHYNESFVTSISLAAVSMIVIILCGSVAYPISRNNSKLNKFLHMLFLAGLMVPPGLTMVPNYKLFRSLHFINTPMLLIALYTAIYLPFTVLIYTGFIKSVPRELDESARIDGCSPFRIYWKVIFPLLRPVNATAIVILSIPIYNDFLNPLLYASKLKTVTLSMYNFNGQYYTAWNMVFAGVTMTMIPPIIVFLLFQKHFEKGLVAGALKG